ncbi:MAG TPA: dihydrodipicolinate synthase family protein [Actinomycetota bacterium]|jgi:dihydrodipicolinate synthase/N-acetylneuraminate lyase
MSMTTGGTGPLRGTLAAAVTPLRDQGERLDEDAFGPLVEFLVDGGVDGILALGTTGEGIMLAPDERRLAVERFIESSGGRLRVAVHAGAQTTSTTCSLARHAAASGADAVAVIGPPYYPFDDEELFRHFSEAARACAPVPFYVYEFAGRSGYAVPLDVLHRLRDAAPNFVGMKVSDSPFERFEPYLLDGVDVLVGPEALILQGMERGAVGAVSGLASAFPEPVADVVRTGDRLAADRAARVRAAAQEFPVPGSMKAILGMRGVPVGPDCRAPLRSLTGEERDRLRSALEGLGVLGPAGAVPPQRTIP